MTTTQTDADLKRGREDDAGNDTESKRARGDGDDRRKKRRMALILGYVGEKYQGMQRNPGVPTIEEEVVQALFKAGCIGERERKNFHLAQWTRSARTDKGVSAAAGVIGVHMHDNPGALDVINNALPGDISVHGLLRATGSFNAKEHCFNRHYEYLIPTKALFQDLKPEQTENAVERLNAILKWYVGTHLFHNFTESRPSSDPSCQRFVTSMHCEPPRLIGEVEMLRVTVVGQSFVLHQIRKMIGLAILAFRGKVPTEAIPVAFEKDQKLRFPMAPALGLLLNHCTFDIYNRRFSAQLETKISVDQVAEKVDTFKRSRIYPSISSKEASGDVMGNWIRSAEKNLTIEPEQILATYRSLDRPELSREEKRKERIASSYPIVESFDDFCDLRHPSVSEQERQTRQERIVAFRSGAEQVIGETPTMFCRVPAALVVMGDNLDELDLPVLGLAMEQEIVAGLVRSRDDAVKFHSLTDKESEQAHMKMSGVRLASGSAQPWTKWVSTGWQALTTADVVDGRSRLASSKCISTSTVPVLEGLTGEAAYLGAAAALCAGRTNRWRLPKSEIAGIVSKAMRNSGLGSCGGPLGVAMNAKRGNMTVYTHGPRPGCEHVELPPSIVFVLIRFREANWTPCFRRRSLECRLAAGLLARRCGTKTWDGPSTSPGRLGRILNKDPAELLALCREHIPVEESLLLEEVAKELGVGLETLRSKLLDGSNTDEQQIRYRVGGRLTHLFGEVLRIREFCEALRRANDASGPEIGRLLTDSERSARANFEWSCASSAGVVEWCSSRPNCFGSRTLLQRDSRECIGVLCAVPESEADVFIADSLEEFAAKQASASKLRTCPGASTWNVQVNQSFV